MMQWNNLIDAGLELGRKVAGALVQVHPQEKLVSFSPLALELASSLALRNISYIKTGRIVAIDRYLHVELEVSGGFQISTRVFPESILLQPEVAVLTFNIPHGIDATHRNAILAFISGAFDSMLGFGVEQIPGIKRTGTRFSYNRRIISGTLVAALAGIILARRVSVDIPIFIDQNKIFLDLHQFPDIALNRLGTELTGGQSFFSETENHSKIFEGGKRNSRAMTRRMRIRKNTVVTIHYMLTNDEGEVLDTSDGSEPMAYIQGIGNLIPGLEAALEGKSVGDDLQVTIPPEHAYGWHDEEMVQVVDRSVFPGVQDLEVGMQFHAQSERGDTQVIWVANIDGDEVTIDGNHPLAGETLHFEVKVVDVREATADELNRGHVYGPGGHHH